MTGIYKITSPTGKVYIGQSWNIASRISQHGSDKKCAKLFCSFKKYGKKQHEFSAIAQLPEDATQQILDNYEQVYLDFYTNAGFSMLNIRGAGSRGKLSPESIEKIKESKRLNSTKGRTPWNKGVFGSKLSIDSILKRTATRKKNNYKHSDETKKKIGAANKIALTGTSAKKIKCPYCEKTGGPGAMTVNHFNNCKLKP